MFWVTAFKWLINQLQFLDELLAINVKNIRVTELLKVTICKNIIQGI